MHRYIMATALAATSVFTISAQSVPSFHISDMDISREHDQIKVCMTVNPQDYRLGTNQRLEISPVLHSMEGTDSIALPSFIIAGRNAYYNTERAEEFKGMLMRSGRGEAYAYSASTEWSDWMEHSRLDLHRQSTGCCGIPDGPENNTPVADLDWRPVTFIPVFHYDVPLAEESKQRRIEGKAYVNFPVNRTEIYPDYMVNPQELRKITSSIDTVRLNPDATVKSITLTGFASPEGPYLNNVRLAKGRTEAVKEYVRGQYTFPASVFHTASVPEDWAGLRDSVATGILADRAGILDFIDNGNIPIEKRNDELRKRFPVSYDYLLKHIYPSLRHTNYAIDYELRTFTDIEEIRRVLRERPQNLSLNEFFLAAKSYPVGSQEYDKVFETAVLYYPESDVANLNAANSAMNEGDLRRARMLLSRIANTPSAVYATAVLDALEGNYDSAESGMRRAAAGGITEAKAALNEIARVKAGRNHVIFIQEPSAK